MQEYTLSSYEDGYYELTKNDEVICEIFSIYEPPMFVSSAERTHTVMIKTNNSCQFKRSFDPDITIVPGIKRYIFDNNDTVVGIVAVGKI